MSIDDYVPILFPWLKSSLTEIVVKARLVSLLFEAETEEEKNTHTHCPSR